MEHSYAIQPAAPEHIPFLEGIERICARLFPSELFPSALLDVTMPADEFHRAREEGRLWIAAGAEGDPVGFSLLTLVDGLAVLAEVDVLPAHGRRGLGRALVERAAKRAVQLGYARLYLTTCASVPWNAPWYARLGFEALAEDETPPAVLALIAAERAAGFADRVAMRLSL